MHCHKCLFHMDNHRNQVGSVMIMGKKIQDPVVHQKHEEKKNLGIFCFLVRDFYFQTSFIKYKTQTNDRFSRHCDSSVESLRLSALQRRFPRENLVKTPDER